MGVVIEPIYVVLQLSAHTDRIRGSVRKENNRIPESVTTVLRVNDPVPLSCVCYLRQQKYLPEWRRAYRTK